MLLLLKKEQRNKKKYFFLAKIPASDITLMHKSYSPITFYRPFQYSFMLFSLCNIVCLCLSTRLASINETSFCFAHFMDVAPNKF